MNFIMIGLLLREALDRLCVRLTLNMYLVDTHFIIQWWFTRLQTVTRHGTNFLSASPKWPVVCQLDLKTLLTYLLISCQIYIIVIIIKILGITRQHVKIRIYIVTEKFIVRFSFTVFCSPPGEWKCWQQVCNDFVGCLWFFSSGQII